MKDSSGSYQTLIKELEDFKNKYYKIAATKGLLVCSNWCFSRFLLLCWRVFSFNSVGRGVLFFVSAVLMMWFFVRQVVLLQKMSG